MQEIVTMIFDTGVDIYNAFYVDFGDVEFNAWWFILGFAIMIVVAEIIGRILK